jgi:nicotinate-nucleotide adenylyltransferase
MIRLPPHAPGMRIGLYGGSFNPPHAGHRHVGLMALRRLALDRLWWLVTPGNPLKDRAGLPPTTARIAAAQACAHDPRIVATGLEEQIGSYYTLETVRFLERRCPGVRFVWIMGADSLASFQRWRGWREIAETLPMAVVDRPGWTLKATRSRAAVALAPYRWDETDAALIAAAAPPAWVFLHGPRSFLSSTELRKQGRTFPWTPR